MLEGRKIRGGYMVCSMRMMTCLTKNKTINQNRIWEWHYGTLLLCIVTRPCLVCGHIMPSFWIKR